VAVGVALVLACDVADVPGVGGLFADAVEVVADGVGDGYFEHSVGEGLVDGVGYFFFEHEVEVNFFNHVGAKVGLQAFDGFAAHAPVIDAGAAKACHADEDAGAVLLDLKAHLFERGEGTDELDSGVLFDQTEDGVVDVAPNVHAKIKGACAFCFDGFGYGFKPFEGFLFLFGSGEFFDVVVEQLFHFARYEEIVAEEGSGFIFGDAAVFLFPSPLAFFAFEVLKPFLPFGFRERAFVDFFEQAVLYCALDWYADEVPVGAQEALPIFFYELVEFAVDAFVGADKAEGKAPHAGWQDGVEHFGLLFVDGEFISNFVASPSSHCVCVAGEGGDFHFVGEADVVGVDGLFFFGCGVEDLDLVFVGGVYRAFDEPGELCPGSAVIDILFCKYPRFCCEEGWVAAFFAAPFVAFIGEGPA